MRPGQAGRARAATAPATTPLPRLGLHRRAARHVGRGTHHVLRWVGSIAAVLILIVLVGIWRLLQGPIELDWLSPYVAAAFDRSGTGLKVAISGVRLGLDRERHQLDLRAENVHVSLPSGAPLASFPEMATSFALSALLRGQLAPTQIIVEHPVLHLIRDATGAITAQIGSGETGAPDIGPQLITELAGPMQSDAPLGLLHQLSVRGATVIVDDRRSGRTWRADRVDLTAYRGSKGVSGNFSLAVPMGTSVPEAHASYRYLAERHLLDLDLSIDDIRPTDIPPLIPELAQLQHIEAPVSGTLRTRIDIAQRAAQGSRLDLTLGSGRVHSEWLPTGSVALDKGELHAAYAPENGEVRLEGLTLDLDGGAQIVATGTLNGVTAELIAAPADARPPGHIGGNFNAAVKNVAVDRIAELWPKAFGAGGRRWVLANIRDGALDEAVVRADVDLDPATHTGSLHNAEGNLRYHDLSVNYFNGLPPAHKVSGTAKFAGSELDFTPTGGVLNGMKLTGGTLALSHLGDPVEQLGIDLVLAGPLQDALEIIDSKPLRYAQAIGIDPSHVGGRTDIQLHFKLPLIADLKMDSVEYGAKATIVGASMQKAVLDRGVSEGNFALEVTRAGAHAQGTARFDGIPSKIDANVFFHPTSGPHAIYKIGLTLDPAAQQRLDVDFVPDRLNGPIALEMTYQTLAANRGEATVLLDLRDATMAIPEADWQKAVNQPGTAKVTLELENDSVTRIPQIEVRAAGLDGRFAALLSNDHKHLDRIEIRRMTVGESEVSGIVSRRDGGGWRADIRAPRIDARHLIKDATTGPASAASLPLAVNARVERLVLGQDRELRGVNAELLRTGGIWRSGHIDGGYTNGHRMSLRFGEGDGRQLTFQSDDLGATLQLLNIGSDVSGGQLTVQGQLTESDGKRTLRAHVEGQNYVVQRASPMTRILALPSLTGFASMLGGSGLPFMTLRGDFVYSGNRLTMERLLAFGEALGITANGWFDLDHDQLELQGTVAPAYAINSIIGNVPIIGQLIGGGAQGLFAANYRLSGSSDNPQVTVNPLSALAPGILREIFAPIVGLPPPRQPPEQHGH